jgi:hypothetical protein
MNAGMSFLGWAINRKTDTGLGSRPPGSQRLRDRMR